MAVETQNQHNAQGTNPIWIVTPGKEGFQVYSPEDRSKLYTVSGSPDAPTCTCDASQWHRNDPNWQCDHVKAVFRGVGDQTMESPATGNGQHAGGPVGQGVPAPAEMTLKRSVSPDGRIDSFSVEFSLPVEQFDEQLQQQAERLVQAQSGVITAFLDSNGHNRSQAQQAPQQPNGAVPAQLVNVSGMQTRNGWRTFINVNADGHNNLRLWGSRKQLAEHLTAAGYGHLASNLNNGVMLNVPCRVVLQPSENGKYMNVEQVLPPLTQGG